MTDLARPVTAAVRLALPALPEVDPTATHEVGNVAPPLEDYDVSADSALLEGLAREGAAWYAPQLRALGERAGQREVLSLGDEANRDLPRLATHDRHGRRRDEVDFCPAWHQLMATAVGEGLSGALTWTVDGTSGQPGSHVARTAGFYVWSQVEGGHLCPISMSYAAAPVLRDAPALAMAVLPPLVSGVYAPELAPLHEKPGILLGMGMTEKQGGSDVRANETRATPVTDGYLLRGHKWFTSAPMSDGFLMLAQAPGGLSCFFVPRVLGDGAKNRLHLARLKDKCGNRSNASSEVELADAVAVLVGAEGRGVRTIIEMVALTRLDCVAGSAALQRVSLAQAIWYTRHRRAFGSLLCDAALMQAVLADLALECEAATTLMMRLAGAVDRAQRGDAEEAAFARIGTAVCKYWICKRTPALTAEALECLGGNGYIEESRMPRYYREAPLNSIWEGAGNINALDVLRAATRDPSTLTSLRAELALAAGRNACYDARLRQFEGEIGELSESRARAFVERAAQLLAAGLLLRHAPDQLGDAYVRARLSDEAGTAFGALPNGLDIAGILERAGGGLPG